MTKFLFALFMGFICIISLLIVVPCGIIWMLTQSELFGDIFLCSLGIIWVMNFIARIDQQNTKHKL